MDADGRLSNAGTQTDADGRKWTLMDATGRQWIPMDADRRQWTRWTQVESGLVDTDVCLLRGIRICNGPLIVP